jgi:hypothetical protein
MSTETRDPIEADGNLHRCFCGKPIWFDAGKETRNLGLTLTEPCWRETNGQPHWCPEPALSGAAPGGPHEG